jgi:hypothetical protein
MKQKNKKSQKGVYLAFFIAIVLLTGILLYSRIRSYIEFKSGQELEAAVKKSNSTSKSEGYKYSAGHYVNLASLFKPQKEIAKTSKASLQDDQKKWGWDYSLTKRCIKTIRPNAANYYEDTAQCSSSGKSWSAYVQSENAQGKTDPEPKNQSFMINGSGSPVVVNWKKTEEGNWAVNLHTDLSAITHPGGKDHWTQFYVADEAGPFPSPDKTILDATVNYNDFVSNGATRAFARWEGFWDEKSHIVQLDFSLNKWGDAHPDKDIVVVIDDKVDGKAREIVHMDGAALGINVSKERDAMLHIDWYRIIQNLIDRGLLDKPKSKAWTTKSIGLGTEVENHTAREAAITSLWISDFRIRSLPDDQRKWGWDYNMTKKCVVSNYPRNWPTFFEDTSQCGSDGKHWLVAVQPESPISGLSVSDPEKGILINGSGSPMRLGWLKHDKNWTVNMTTDTINYTHPGILGDEHFTWYIFGDFETGPYPKPDKVVFDATVNFNDENPPMSKASTRAIAQWGGWWDDSFHIIELNFSMTNWGQEERFAGTNIITRADYYKDYLDLDESGNPKIKPGKDKCIKPDDPKKCVKAGEFLNLNGPFMGIEVPKGKDSPLHVYWYRIIQDLIDRGQMDKPKGNWETVSVAIAHETDNKQKTNSVRSDLWFTDFRIGSE